MMSEAGRERRGFYILWADLGWPDQRGRSADYHPSSGEKIHHSGSDPASHLHMPVLNPVPGGVDSDQGPLNRTMTGECSRDRQLAILQKCIA